MKSLVVASIVAITTVMNAAAGNLKQNFAYNETVNEQQQVTSATVYTVEDGKYLYNHLKYEYSYDDLGRLVRKEVLKWDVINSLYERHYCINYEYAEGETRLELALWDKHAGRYGEARAMSVYSDNGGVWNYRNYAWNDRNGDWCLTVEHDTRNEHADLLADK